MWWGGFSEEVTLNQFEELWYSLNPHVVGRFFRESLDELNAIINDVLIPMWWGGFSEPARLYRLGNGMEVLIPMWWGGFSETQSLSLHKGALSLNPHVVGRFFRGFVAGK